MYYTVPDYYNEFSCIAGDCPDTCCAGWQIVIDDASKKKYKSYSGDYGKTLRKSIDFKEGVFKQNEKRCAFLNDDNLCDLYINAGETMLCKTCKRYPRHVEEYEDLREISLSLSCPVVARMLIERKQKVKFFSVEKKMRPEEYEEFDYMLFTKLTDARELMISILQNREADIRLRLAMVLSLAHDLQRRIDQGRLCEADELFTRYQKENVFIAFEKRIDNCLQECDEKRTDKMLESMISLFDKMEILKEDFIGYRKQRYEKLWRADITEEEAVSIEQLAVYFIYTYFCGAVYDEQAYGKVKFAVCSVLLIRQLYLGDERCRGTFCGLEQRKEARIEAAYRYSKEIEHSDLNLVEMEKLLLKKGVFRMEDLICVIFR